MRDCAWKEPSLAPSAQEGLQDGELPSVSLPRGSYASFPSEWAHVLTMKVQGGGPLLWFMDLMGSGI